MACGADYAYIGSAFIATKEANATDGYKEAITKYNSNDIVYTDLVTGVKGNYLKPSLAAAGFDPDNLPKSDPSKWILVQLKVWIKRNLERYMGLWPRNGRN